MSSVRFAAFLVFTVIWVVLKSSKPACAYVVREVEPGIVEIRSAQDGILVPEGIYTDKNRRWIYVAVKETRLTSRLPAAYLSPRNGDGLKYFYAPYRDFKIDKKQRFKFIQFGIEHRILNSKGEIPFGSQRYFYPLVYFQGRS